MRDKIALKVLALSIALVLVTSGVVMYGYSGIDGEKGVSEGGGEGAISLVPPSFVATARAAEVAGGGVSAGTPKTIFVPDNYPKIQWAVDNASDGDTIIVRDGTYYENVDVNKKLTLKGLSYPVVDAGGSGSAIIISADGVVLEGFTATNSGGSFMQENAGIKVISNNNNIISNNVNNNLYGIIVIPNGWGTSNNNTLINNNASNNERGIFLSYPNNSILKNNIMSDNHYNFGGLFEVLGGGVTSFSNDIDTSNRVDGKPIYYFEGASGTVIDSSSKAGTVYCINCDNVTVKDLTLTNNMYGIYFYNVSNSRIQNNRISNNSDGIHFWYSTNNTIIGNNVSSNNLGIDLGWYGNNNNTIIDNIVSSNNYYGIYFKQSGYSIITGNIVNSNNIGIYLYMICDNNTITNNNASNNDYGIYLQSSEYNTITNNNVSNNNYGIYLQWSSPNKIYLNNFINKVYNVYSYHSSNIWNSTEKITYTYNGKTYTNYLGNYWSDYTGNDTDKDGIGDTPYSIDSDKDNYPLMEPWESYFKPPEEEIFDTGQPANPYPSIMGDHTGTIKPNHTVIATKLYTYSCPGTGGHTEYVKIWNETGWNATAYWNGYIGDWHILTFDKPVVLMANEPYNYSIRTGSYPQIYHTPALSTANGWINCTEFVDANGRVYYDWIPAIKLQ